MQAKLIISFEHLREEAFLAKSGYILTCTKDNPDFREPWTPPVPSHAQISTAFETYRDAYDASQTHDTVHIAHRNACRQALMAMLKQLATYLELVANGDVEKLETTGFDLRQDIVRGRTHEAPDQPADFRVEHGSLSGTLNVHAASSHGGDSHDVEIAQGDPLLMANWHHALSAPSGTPLLLEGLMPGQTYWLRLRAINKYGAGPWTMPVCIIVN